MSPLATVKRWKISSLFLSFLFFSFFQFLSKTVSGVIHTIKDVLPHFDDDDVHGEFVNTIELLSQ